MTAFVAELRQLSEHCGFGAVVEDILRNRLICGINDDGMQRWLWGEATLSFKKALEIPQAMETAVNNTKDIQSAARRHSSCVQRQKRQAIKVCGVLPLWGSSLCK